jgi:WD40 repeat protein
MFNIRRGDMEFNFGTIHGDLIDALAITPSGRYAFTGSNDRKLLQWDLQAKSLEYSWGVIHERSVTSVAISPDSSLLLSASNGCMKLFNIWDRALIYEIGDAHDGYIYNIRMSGCGGWAFTVSQDGHLKQWGIGSAGFGLHYDYGKVHDDYIRAMAITPCGTYVFTAGIDGTMKQFNVKAQSLFLDYGKVSGKAIYW